MFVLVFCRKQSKRVLSDNGRFDLLPREVILHIFKYLNLYTLSQCCQVSKLFYQVCTHTLATPEKVQEG
jgi:hypothetical protein